MYKDLGKKHAHRTLKMVSEFETVYITCKYSPKPPTTEGALNHQVDKTIHPMNISQIYLTTATLSFQASHAIRKIGQNKERELGWDGQLCEGEVGLLLLNGAGISLDGSEGSSGALPAATMSRSQR